MAALAGAEAEAEASGRDAGGGSDNRGALPGGIHAAEEAGAGGARRTTARRRSAMGGLAVRTAPGLLAEGAILAFGFRMRSLTF